MAPTGEGPVSTQSAPSAKYTTPSSVTRGSKDSYLQVKQRKNGQYVVVERLPVRTRTRNHGLPTLQQSLAESEVKLNSLKPGWMPTPKVKDAGGGGERRDSTYPALPPIDMGWREKAEAVVGSLVNVEHEPGGGNKPIPKNRVRWAATAKVGSLDNVHYKGGGSPRSTTSHSDPSNSKRRVSSMLEVSARYGALAKSGGLGPGMHYNPGAGIDSVARYRRYQHAQSRVGSLDNIAHVPGGGDLEIEHRRHRWTSEAKVGSLDNARHVPGGGDVSITSQRLQWQAKPRVGSLDNVSHVPRATGVRIPRNRTSWEGRPRVGSLDNIHHVPGGGLLSIPSTRLRWNAQSKVDSRPPRRRNSYGSSLESLDSH